MRRQSACLTLAAAGLLGCVSGFDRNDQIVSGLRILAIGQHVDDTTMQTDPTAKPTDWADADVGDTVHLQALVTNPGGLSTVTVTWLACLPITGQTQPCTDDAYLRKPAAIIPLADDPANTGVLKLGTGTSVDYTVPEDVKPLLQNLLDNADQHVNAECALYTQIPLLVIAQDGQDGPAFAAVKNLRLSPWHDIATGHASYQFYVRNVNPQIAAFNISPTGTATCDGQPLATPCLTDADCTSPAACSNGACSGVAPPFPDGPQVICLDVEQAQSYYTCGLDGPQQPIVPEQPDVIWYMTGGALSGFSAPNDGSGGSVSSRTFTHFTRPAGPFTIYGVARDHRDGETWIAQNFQ